MKLISFSARDLRAECKHFRVLIIGRANAGKTTILRKVCGARADENPEILRAGGDKQVELQGSAERGKHDIEDELVFKSNPQFIFHDSEGFESGSTSQVEKVKEFIKSKSEGRSLPDQLHAIWCCLPTDTTRPLNGFEKDFFDKNVHGNGRCLEFTVENTMTHISSECPDRGLEDEVAGDKEGLEEDAKTHLKNYFHIPLHRLESDFLVLSDMHEENTECDELIAKTTNALTNDALKLLLVSVQQNNINLCTFYAVTWVLEGKESFQGSVECILQWFPHFWVR
ncbi:hypothetical protein C8F01DRAFT_1256583 [Mycena amicta]|nr:hypothetical protein C8F01DRAFT_1256583 [Mycena amicta]